MKNEELIVQRLISMSHRSQALQTAYRSSTLPIFKLSTTTSSETFAIAFCVIYVRTCRFYSWIFLSDLLCFIIDRFVSLTSGYLVMTLQQLKK